MKIEIEKKYICNKCKTAINDHDFDRTPEAVLAVQFMRNEKQPMWKKLLLGDRVKKILLCKNCLRDFEHKMNDFMF